MPGPTPDPVEGATELPSEADVVIVGGGIVGTSAALELAERGLSVVLCEKGVIAGEQSSRNWGWVRLSRRDPREIDLMIEAIRIWEGLAERVGTDVGYRKCGILVPFFDEATARTNLDWLEYVAERQTRITAVDRAQVDALLPGLTLAHQGGLYAPNDGRAEPQRAAPALARAAQRRGAVVMTGCAVRAIETAGGAVCGVATEHGPVAARAVIVAGGAWSRLLLRGVGISLPQLKVTNSVMRTTPVPGGPELTVRGPDFSVRRRADGGYSISTLAVNRFDFTPDSFRLARAFLPALKAEWRHLRPRLGRRFLTEWREGNWDGTPPSPFEVTRILDPAPDIAMTDKAFAAAKAAIPALASAEPAQRWAGLIDVTPDAVPVISTVETRPGLVVATGFSGHGFAIGPAAGRLAADLATGARPIVDPAAFRLSRFSDGSPIVPMAGI